jgi:hypothetical protein
VAPVKKLEEDFVLKHILKKKLSQFFKLRFHLPKILPKSYLVETGENVVL